LNLKLKLKENQKSESGDQSESDLEDRLCQARLLVSVE
jgi:hypothetical protein